MCGRYLIISAPEAFRRLFDYDDVPNFPPRYNVAPTQPIPIVRVMEGKRRFALVRWGLIPPWVKDPRAFSLLINARSESVNEKPAFRNGPTPSTSRSPTSGFGSITSHGSRSARRTFHAWRSWLTSRVAPRSTLPRTSIAASRSERSNGRAAPSQRRGTSSIQRSASSARSRKG